MSGTQDYVVGDQFKFCGIEATLHGFSADRKKAVLLLKTGKENTVSVELLKKLPYLGRSKLGAATMQHPNATTVKTPVAISNKPPAATSARQTHRVQQTMSTATAHAIHSGIDKGDAYATKNTNNRDTKPAESDTAYPVEWDKDRVTGHVFVRISKEDVRLSIDIHTKTAQAGAIINSAAKPESAIDFTKPLKFSVYRRKTVYTNQEAPNADEVLGYAVDITTTIPHVDEYNVRDSIINVGTLAYTHDPAKTLQVVNADVCAHIRRWLFFGAKHLGVPITMHSLGEMNKRAQAPTIHVHSLPHLDGMILQLQELRKTAIHTRGQYSAQLVPQFSVDPTVTVFAHLRDLGTLEKNAAEDTTEQQPAKRGRGRPRKNAVASLPVVAQESAYADGIEEVDDDEPPADVQRQMRDADGIEGFDDEI